MDALADAELDHILHRLISGEVLEQWGYAMHRDFVSLFNASGGLWQRDTADGGWRCVSEPRDTGIDGAPQ